MTCHGRTTTTVLALHCSGASGRQWRRLQEQARLPGAAGAIGMVAPDLYGTASAGHWPGQHAFSLADEAERLLSLPDLPEGRFHLVGHSAAAWRRPHGPVHPFRSGKRAHPGAYRPGG